MLSQLIKQSSFVGVSNGNVANTRIPPSGTKYAIYILPKQANGDATAIADIKANLGNMVVKLNGEQIIEMTATFALDLQKYYGDQKNAGNVDGVVPIFLAPDYLPTFSERSVYAIGMEGITSFTVDINITGVTNMSFIDVITEETPEKRVVGQHIRIRKTNLNHPSASEQEITQLPLLGPTAAYKAIHLQNANISKVTCKTGNYAFYDQIENRLNNTLLQRSGRKNQTGYFHISFDRNNDLTSMLPMAGIQDFRVYPTFTVAPNSYFAYSEEIHGLLATPSNK